MMRKFVLTIFAGLFAFGLAAGCAKKADTSKSVEQIKTEVQSMSLKEVEGNAKAYVQEIQARKSEVQKVTQQVKSLSPAEIFGEKAKGLKDQIAKLGSEVNALTERYQVYAQKYQELGGNAANIQVA